MQKRIDWKRPECIAALSAFFGGLAVHMFGLVNVLHNHDDIIVQPNGFGTGLSSGRWFLQWLGDWSKEHFGGYNLPWLNGILFIALIAIAVGFFISVFEIENHKAAALIGLIFVSFPPVASVMFFRFTTVYYGISILLAVLAAWFLIKVKFCIFLSVVCSALSLGIYQGYMPLTISILVLYLIKQVLHNDLKSWKIIVKGVYFCVALVLGLMMYMFILQICLENSDVVLSGYKGVNQMGQLNLAELPKIIWLAMETFYKMPFDNYCDLARMELLKNAYLVIEILTVLIAILTAVINKLKIDKIVLLIMLLAILPLAINFIMVMCPNVSIYTIMAYAFAVVPCTPIVLWEELHPLHGWSNWMRRVIGYTAAVAVSLVVICNAYMTNLNYTISYYANQQAKNYLVSMVTQIRTTEGFDTEKTWATIGTLNDKSLNNAWQKLPMYGGNKHSRDLLTSYSWRDWIYHYSGCSYAWANAEEIAELQKNEAVKNMPCWPNDGSVKVIGDYVVIKFSES